MDEMNFMNFVSKNIDEIISLYMSERTSNQNELISEEILQALNFLLEGSVDNLKTVMPLSQLVRQSAVQSHFVKKKTTHVNLNNQPYPMYNQIMKQKNDGKIYLKNLVTFLKSYIELNPYGQTYCLRSGKRIIPSYVGGSVDPKKVGKIVSNANLNRNA
jgi:hypothetical protein